MAFKSLSVDSRCVASDVSLSSKGALFDYLGNSAHSCFGLDAAQVSARLQAREAVGSTGFGHGIALPHARFDALEEGRVLLVRLAQPLDFAAHDGAPVDIVCALLSPEKYGADHLKNLAALSRLLRNDAVLVKLRGARGPDALYAALTGDPGLLAA
ncbi:MAG: PTS sugar transporter subunit IIA [Parasphingorhabdus sp.]|nr:PTS sugar transporter subunit IIA [Parasphingorhabdus sp.]